MIRVLSLRGVDATCLPAGRRSNLMQGIASLALAMTVLCCACTTQSFDDLYKRAEGKIGVGDTDAALSLYKRIVKKYPDDPRTSGVLIRVAELYSDFLNDDVLAKDAYSAVIEKYPLTEASIVARLRRASICEKSGDLECAISDYSALLKFFPDSEERHQFRLSLVGAYLSQRNFKQARQEIIPLFEDKGAPPEVMEQALFVAGESFFLDDKPEKAIPYYQDLIKMFPKSKYIAEAKLHLATCIEEMGYLGIAKEYTKDAAKTYPNPKVIDEKVKSLNKRGW